METKQSLTPFKVKAAGPDDGLNEGEFEGYCSVFGNKDSYGDIVQPGAFAKSLEEWDTKGDPIPLLWGHDLEDPFSNIGVISKAEEDERGLKVRGAFDLDNPKAQQVYKLAKGRRTTGMSFAYAVRDAEQKDDGNHLKDLHIFEASIVPIGANPEAGVLAVKAFADTIADGVKAGRTLSAKNEATLRDAAKAIEDVLASLGGDSTTQEPKASDNADAKASEHDDEPPAKSSQPAEEPKSHMSPVEALAAQINIYALKGAGRDSR